ncbi:MAG TPA: RAMP superfamily CRISPR-associated protein [Candidatus Ozemobacteraceae bacterium]|nr:RAMP superfamily CRISPR-associated protein [Candidatus Ozemobacteraceae bacterium]
MPELRTTHLNIRLHVLSPIHIGCDQVYEPTEFVIPDGQDGTLVVFDPISFVSLLDGESRARFEKICMDGKLAEIYRFIGSHAARLRGRPVGISKDLVQHYRRTFFGAGNAPTDSEINKFTLARTSFEAFTSRPLIPGSSLKGSLRTAYLNLVAGQSPRVTAQSGKWLEKDLLHGDYASDPFSLLKIGDLQPLQAESSIGYAMNWKKRKQPGTTDMAQGKGPYQILEIIQPGSVFTGRISLTPSPSERRIDRPITLKALFEAVFRFYRARFKEDQELLGGLSYPKSLAPILAMRDSGKAFFVRIGRHSGAESVTLDGYRSIKIMRGQPPYQKNATTVWLYSDRLRATPSTSKPFGWALLELVDEGVAFPPPKIEEKPTTSARMAGPTPVDASPSPAIAPAAKTVTTVVLLERNQTPTGTITGEIGKWQVTFPGEARPITISNPQAITRAGSAMFLVQEASKKAGVRVRFEKYL